MCHYPRHLVERKKPLFEKSGAKTFVTQAGGCETSTAQNNKVFLLIFVHKK